MGAKHHYVPRLYLKRFAVDTDNPKAISLYNIKQAKHIPNASLYQQCFKLHFYGLDDDIEKMLSVVEGRFASVLRKIESEQIMPNRKSEEYYHILLFISMQWLRTKRAADDVDELTDKIAKATAEEYYIRNNMHDQIKHLDRVRISNKNPVMMSLIMSGRLTATIADLTPHLLKAGSDIEFITSDHPVQFYNKYCEGVDLMGVTGSLCRGLIIFFPLTPRLCLVLYDAKVYKMGKAHETSSLVHLESDMLNINALQLVGASDNLYFAPPAISDHITQLATKYKSHRRKREVRVKVFDVQRMPERSIMMNYNPMPNLRLSTSFISIRRSARKVPLIERAQAVRSNVLPPDPFNFDDNWERSYQEAYARANVQKQDRGSSIRLIEKLTR